jgi:hypothetical protein
MQNRSPVRLPTPFWISKPDHWRTVSGVLDFLTPVVSRGIVHVRRSPIRLQDWVRVSSCFSSRNGLPRTSQPPRWYALSISEQLPSNFESKYVLLCTKVETGKSEYVLLQLIMLNAAVVQNHSRMHWTGAPFVNATSILISLDKDSSTLV